MKINVVILDSSKDYLSRLQTYLLNAYADKLSLWAFSDADSALALTAEESIHIFLASPGIDVDLARLPSKCVFAYLVEDPAIEEYQSKPTVSKYIKTDDFYKKILALFHTISGDFGLKAASGESANVLTFTSPAGGVGTTTAAVACARTLVSLGKKVLYVSLGSFENADLYFSSEGAGTWSDIVYAVKSGKGNLAMAFGAYVRSSTSGVSYFAAPEHAADLLELSEAEWLEVVSALVKLDVYDCIVFDIPWGTNKLVQYFLKRSLRTLMVSDGRVGSNDKVSRALDTLRILDQRNSTSFAQGIAVFYNKFSTRNTARIPNLTEAGGINRYEGLGDAAVVDAIVADKRLLAYCQGVFA